MKHLHAGLSSNSSTLTSSTMLLTSKCTSENCIPELVTLCLNFPSVSSSLLDYTWTWWTKLFFFTEPSLSLRAALTFLDVPSVSSTSSSIKRYSTLLFVTFFSPFLALDFLCMAPGRIYFFLSFSVSSSVGFVQQAVSQALPICMLFYFCYKSPVG